MQIRRAEIWRWPLMTSRNPNAYMWLFTGKADDDAQISLKKFVDRAFRLFFVVQLVNEKWWNEMKWNRCRLFSAALAARNGYGFLLRKYRKEKRISWSIYRPCAIYIAGDASSDHEFTLYAHPFGTDDGLPSSGVVNLAFRQNTESIRFILFTIPLANRTQCTINNAASGCTDICLRVYDYDSCILYIRAHIVCDCIGMTCEFDVQFTHVFV